MSRKLFYCHDEIALQRLFSTFPNGWPGVGLLILRLCDGIALVYFGTVDLQQKLSQPMGAAPDLIGAACGLLLIAGLWTPIVGAAAALAQLWIVLASYPSPRDHAWPIFVAVVSASLAMLGPGAWSMDAKLFGRRRVVIDRPRKTAGHPSK